MRQTFLLLLASFFLNVGIAQEKSKQPNVLFIIVDDYNDYSGAFGGHVQVKTPNIDKLAKSGVSFINAQTNAPVCSPSRNSLFTGVYPHESKDFGWTTHLQHVMLKNNKTFIQLFKENGYRTLGSGKLLHKNQKNLWNDWGVKEGLNYGPHAYNGKEVVGHPNVKEPFRSINIVDGSFAPLSDVPVFKEPKGDGKRKAGWGHFGTPYRYVNENDRDLLPDEMHAEWAVKKLKELEKDKSGKPFFMGVGFVRPHTPLYAPKRFFDMYPLDQIKLPVLKKNDAKDCHYTEVYPDTEMGLHYYKALKEAYGDDEKGLKLVIQAYLACVTFMDEQVGVVMDALNNSKFKDNTIVVFTSDHGWQFGEKEYLYKNSPWEESTRVPMIVRVPNESKAGTKVAHPVSLIDVYPTLKDLCELKGNNLKNEKGGRMGGHSFRPFIKNPELKKWEGPNGALTVMGAGINKPIEGLAVTTNPKALWHIKVIKELDDEYILQQNYSYRTENWRYIRYRNGKEELYNHQNDPYEWKNLASKKKYADKLKALRAEVMNMIQPKSN